MKNKIFTFPSQNFGKMETNFTKSILTGIFLLLVLASFVSALQTSTGNVVAGIWFDSNPDVDSLTVTNGASIPFNVYGLAVGSSLHIQADLVKSDGTTVPIADILQSSQSFNEFGVGSEGDYTITPTEYVGIGTYTIRLIVTGDSSSTAVLELTLVVQGTNNPPAVNNIANQQINEGQAFSYQVVATDPDGNPLTYSLTANPGWLSISNSGLITGAAPFVSANTNYPVTVSVTDGTNSVTKSFTLTVNNIPGTNNPPAIVSSPILIVNEGQAYSYNVIAIDPEGNALTYSLSASPAWLSINSATGAVTGTAPAVTSNQNFNVVATVSDGINSVNQAYVLTVLDTSVLDTQAPVVVITSPTNTAYTSQRTQLTYTATDNVGVATCWYSTNLGVTNSTPVACTGTFSINSVQGTNTWTVYAQDASGNVGSATVTFTVSTSSGGGSSNNDKVVYTYQDPDEEKFVAQTEGFVAPKIDLTPETQKSWLAGFIEAIINFLKRVFS